VKTNNKETNNKRLKYAKLLYLNNLKSIKYLAHHTQKHGNHVTNARV